MFTLVATFDEVMHVHRNRANRTTPRHTVFSFMSDFKYTPYVTVPGFPRLEKGMRVVALLRNEGDWKTLVGWRDLETGELAAPELKFHAYRVFFVLLWAAVFVYLGVGSLAGADGQAEWLLAVPLGFAGVFAVLEYRRIARARAELQELERLPREA